MSEQAEPQFLIQKIYLKDASFESPNSPAIFTQEWAPKTNVQLNTEHRPMEDDHHEVVLKVTVEATSNENMAYLVELQLAGVFLLKGFEAQQMGHMLGSFCPNTLFPYVREGVASLVIKGGFPELQLAPINFDALYAQHLKQQAEKAGEATAH